MATGIASVAVAIAALGMGALVLWGILYRRSLKRMTEAVHSLASGDLAHRLYPQRGQEEVRLAHAINSMAEGFQRTLEAVESERGRLNAVLSSMDDGVLLADTHKTVLLANPAFERIFRVPPDKAKDRPVMEVVLDHDVLSLLDRCLTAGQQLTSYPEIGPERRFFRVIATPIRGPHGPSALLLFQDQSEAQRLDKTRREFVSNISHELRTPLASIKAMVEALQEGARGEEELAQDFLARIVSEVDHMTTLVGEIMNLSSIESGQAQLQLDSVDVGHLLRDLVDRLRPQAERRKLTLSLEQPPSLPAARADEGRLREAVVNLLHNAMMFTGAGGTITVSSEAGDTSLLVKVSDTGIGIPEEDLPHIYERFFKVDKSRTTEGAGLGLAIAKHIVEAHHGSIWATSREGSGSTFYFTLPTTR